MTNPKPNMREYILKTPESIKNCLEASLDSNTEEFIDILCNNKGQRIVITGCGTSYNLAILFERYLGADGDISAVAVPSTDLLNYRQSLLKNSIIVAISHSGATKATVDVIKKAKENNITVVSLTSNEKSAMASLSDIHIKLAGGYEASMPKTLTFTCSAIQILNIVSNINKRTGKKEIHIPPAGWLYEAMKNAIEKNEDALVSMADGLKNHNRFIFIGAGVNWLLAEEIALKMRETNYSSSLGFEMEEFTHGNTTLLEKGTAVIIISHKGPSEERALDIFESARYLEASTVIVGDKTVDNFRGSDYAIRLDTSGDEFVDSLIYALPLQLFAYHISAAMGKDPDTLRRDDERYDHVAVTWIFPPGTH